MYSTQAQIADDPYMRARVAQAAAEQGCAIDAGIDPDLWALEWKRVWSSAPGWSDAWESALAQEPPLENIGLDPGVVTDAQILSQVQSMMPFTLVADHKPVIENPVA